ncbi:hypothetical protein KQX54_015930 [Cotesia glomerata]|uniref:Uncharacterized protein n=1 Tax=Cotesia glomerata TaxID=32391 RepID=A0AAV7IH00_COTGL|nr:hypothetical protein KQX54_015930 [Cotesia glomerata]
MDSSNAEVSTIFHPRRSRAPSIILNDEQTGHPYASPGHVVVDTGCEQQGCSVTGGCDSASSCRSLETSSGLGIRDPSGGSAGGGQGHNQPSHTGSNVNYQTRRHSIVRCFDSCCAQSAKKVCLPFFLSSVTHFFDIHKILITSPVCGCMTLSISINFSSHCAGNLMSI